LEGDLEKKIEELGSWSSSYGDLERSYKQKFEDLHNSMNEEKRNDL
jgi:hypothetical protein